MALRKKKDTLKSHKFNNKLILNQWLISLFGIDPLQKYPNKSRPFHQLAESIRDPRIEGLDNDNIHKFYHCLVNSSMFWDQHSLISKDQLLRYDQNIVKHTMLINDEREKLNGPPPIVWKYFQWLALLFTEIYLDRYFNDPQDLLNDLNTYLEEFNNHWDGYTDIPPYNEDDLNKICVQNATGSGKTLLMHVNIMQFRHYADITGKHRDITRVILLTPREELSQQHLVELRQNGFHSAVRLNTTTDNAPYYTGIDVTEITKLADNDGPSIIATRSLGDQNLLLVDEGHRGMSSKEEGAWFTRRGMLCDKGFTFEYSATFEQAVRAAKNSNFENSYAKTVLFDYSYRWFYEDGFGKDYRILNMPTSYTEVQQTYLTACLLAYYQQICVYQDRKAEFIPFNLEKPLWVFVGSTVSKAKGGTNDEKVTATDIAKIIQFLTVFLSDVSGSQKRIQSILFNSGKDTGLLDDDGEDIFYGTFRYLSDQFNRLGGVESMYKDIMKRVFNHSAGGQLSLERIKGDSGEVLLKVGTSETPFGLINVGDALGLCNHCEEVCTNLTVGEVDFTDAIFSSVKDSESPVNVLIGSKKFVEGWDCWRVSTLGLMHVGKNEGTQIIQLFGRGVRLKGYSWSLKRSAHAFPPRRPEYIEILETLNVFGIEADFMEKFRQFLKEEGLPGNEKPFKTTIPLTVVRDFGKRLKILRPKKNDATGKAYDFKKDGPIPMFGNIPNYLIENPVNSDWYPKIFAISSKGHAPAKLKDKVYLDSKHLAMLDYDSLYFEVEKFKRERSWYNLNITKLGIQKLLTDKSWYRLFVPKNDIELTSYKSVHLLKQIAGELLRTYCEHFYKYMNRAWLEPRLELCDLTEEDGNFPTEVNYTLITDESEEHLISDIRYIKNMLEENKDSIIEQGSLKAAVFENHLYHPLLHVDKNSKITILPVSLHESEYEFVVNLMDWIRSNAKILEKHEIEVYLLRNLERGRGVGFFEAGNFHPDFIMWVLKDNIQYVNFIEPHGLQNDGPGSEKILFPKNIKDVENRLNDPSVILNCFILSWTPYQRLLNWNKETSKEEHNKNHILFMAEDKDDYINMMMNLMGLNWSEIC